MTNEKSLYSSQNFVVKAITIMSDIANSVLLASEDGPSGGPINHINIVKACMNGITLLGHVSAEFERKRKITYETSFTEILLHYVDQNQAQLPTKQNQEIHNQNTFSAKTLNKLQKMPRDQRRSLRKIPIENTLRCKVNIIHQLTRKNLFLYHGRKTGQNLNRPSTKQGQHYNNNNRHSTARKFCN